MDWHEEYVEILECLDMKIDVAIDGQLSDRLTGKKRERIKAQKKEQAWERLLDHLVAIACPPEKWPR